MEILPGDEQMEQLRNQIADLVSLHADMMLQREGDRSAFVTGWVIVYECTSSDLHEEDASFDDVIVPANQSRATTRGLLGLGLDHYTRSS